MALRYERREIRGKEDDTRGYKTEDDSEICGKKEYFEVHEKKDV
jgi:hypothetical protein